MKQKKILIATKFFHPDITPRAFRAFELAREFARKGHEVVVITEKRNYNYDLIEREYKIKVKAIVNNHPPELKGNNVFIRTLRFGLNHFLLYPLIMLTKHFKTALMKEEGYDLLISIAFPYPVHFGVALAKKRNTKLTSTWVADCGDPFSGIEGTRLPFPYYYKTLEKWFSSKPDFITIPIQEARKAYLQSCQNKIRIIPQGFDFDIVRTLPKYTKTNKVTFAYAGSVGSSRLDPSKLLDYLTEIETDFKFIIYTKNKPFLSKYKELLREKLELRDYVPREQLLRELSAMDFLIHIETKSSVQKSSKLIDYTLINKPILPIKTKEVDRQRFNDFLQGNYSEGLKISNIEDYNIINVANQFLNLSIENKNIEC